MSKSNPFGIALIAALLVSLSVEVAHGIDPETSKQNKVDARLAPQAADGDSGFVEPKPGQEHAGHPLGGWYLGVYGRYTSTGLVLTQVIPQTAAANAGLEVGDRIVAVNGRQVGVVLGSHFTLDVVLQQQAGRRGRVRLLVQDRRTHQLINMDVQLVRGRVHT